MSWPVRRIGIPSVSSVANASASACAQMIPSPVSIASRRCSSCLIELGVDVEAVGDRQQLLAEHLETVECDRGLDLGRGRAIELVLAGRVIDALGAGDPLLELLVLIGQHLPDRIGHLGRLLLGDDSLLDQQAREQLPDRRVLLDRLVHLGLRVCRLVGLVVAEAAVADQVDQHVVAELLAERERESHGGDAGGDVVGVDVDDRNVEALRQVRRPGRRARVVGIGGEADLVVLDQVDRAADRVAVERLQVERLGDHALAREGRVAVQRDRDRSVRVLMGVGTLTGGLRRAGGARRDRSDELEVRRV